MSLIRSCCPDGNLFFEPWVVHSFHRIRVSLPFSYNNHAKCSSVSYATLDLRANHAGLPIIFTSIAHLPSMLKLLPNVPSVKAVVCMERLEGTEGEMAKDWGRREGVWVEDFEGCLSPFILLILQRYILLTDVLNSTVKQMGRANRIDPIPPKPESIATISCQFLIFHSRAVEENPQLVSFGNQQTLLVRPATRKGLY